MKRWGKDWNNTRIEGGRYLERLTRARDVDLLGTDNDEVLAVQQLLGGNGGKASQHVGSAIDNDFLYRRWK